MSAGEKTLRNLDAEIVDLREQLRLYQAEEERLLEDRRRDREEIDALKYGTIACPRCGAEFDRSDAD